MEATLTCPRCKTTEIITRYHARKACGIVGTVAGAGGSFAAAIGGAEAGAILCAIAGPPGMAFGGLAGAVFGALLGGAAGCAAGALVGTTIDENLLNNYECAMCGHEFGNQHLKSPYQ